MSDFATKIISSWDEFNKLVLARQSEGREWIYRGQPKAWPLKTTIERSLHNWEIDLGEATSIEFQTIREFRRRMREPRHHRVHEDTLFCLALMRHHGAPTRLLGAPTPHLSPPHSRWSRDAFAAGSNVRVGMALGTFILMARCSAQTGVVPTGQSS